ncbi:TPA: hypothetical protein N0F65_009491 [Lagenidium giganteum]|uniref:Retroviral polymerase SH3-like domain-containing protein n=1 Tax=Lagenidium giganteum TaxID=4803 RepID=A0AAV2Z9Z6_9STRA|nr:TPA: hypothetical protein N0F65_009491 [Lagenidium giganteum]
MVRTLCETARSMLTHADMAQKYWADAVAAASFTRNRCPSKAINDRFPVEIWNPHRPAKIANLKVLGCLAFARVPDAQSPTFDHQSRRCALLGYSEAQDAYRLLDLINRKVVTARKVRFDEATFPLASSIQTEPATIPDNEEPTTDKR